MKYSPSALCSIIAPLLILSTFNLQVSTAFAQGTAFTYQGRLAENGTQANGIYDLRFTIYDLDSGGVAVAGPITNAAMAVSNGLFTVALDFGAGVFDGNARWLEIGVKSNGAAGAHIPLTPRQRLTATPYAIHSSNASIAASVAAGGVTSAAIADDAVTATKIAPGAVSQLDAPDGSPLNALLVNTNGFVGLGTTAPQAGLHLATGPQMYDGIWRFRIKDGAVGYTNLGFVVSVAVSGTLAVAAAYGDSAVTVLNLSNPTSPVKQSELRDGVNGFNDLGGAYGVALSSNLLAVAAYSDNAVTLVDLSSPTNPVLRATLKNGVGGFNELSGAATVALRGSLLAVADDDAVTLVDVSNPAAPALRAVLKDGVGGFDYLSGPASMAFSSNLLAVVAFQDQAVNLIDVSNPAAPVLLSTIREGVGGFGFIGQLQGLAFFGNTLAFGSWSSGVAFFADISNPAAPLQKSAVAIGTGVRSLAVRGNLLAAAIGDGNNVTLIDITDTAAPVVRGVIPDIESTSVYEGVVTVAFTSSGFLFFGSADNSAIGLLGIGGHQTSLSSDGWVGVGTSLPQAPLHVRGSVLVENASVVSLHGNQVELGSRASASGSFATAIGTDARAEGNFSVVSGGAGNRVVVGAADASVGGGRENVNAAVGATISGGLRNAVVAGANYASIGGGRQNSASGQLSTVAGGFNNLSGSSASFIGGGEGNSISNAAPHAVIAGGIGNRSDAGASFIGGGTYNTNNGGGAVIGGGFFNRTEHFDAFVGAGAFNVNAGYRAFIGGGEGNSISNTGPYATVGGGYANRAQGNSSTVGGGGLNNAAGLNATVPGGAFSDALGDYSFASGRRAKAFHPGAFVWADSTDADFASTSNNQFSVRAGGGVRLVTSGAGMTLDGQPVLSGAVGSAQIANGSVVRSLNSLSDNVTLVAGTNVMITPLGNTLQIAASFLGPVSDSQLSANIPRLNAAATFTGPVTANNAANSFNGAFAGNGGGLTNVNAASLGGLGTSSFWRTGGNAGTTPGANFLGTTDNQALELKVNGTRALRIEPTPVASLVGGFFQNNAGGFRGAVIAGGGTSASANEVHGDYGFVGAGHGGKAGNLSAVVGGAYNSSLGQFSFIGSGIANTNSATNAVLGGGMSNRITANAFAAFIGGGQYNLAEATNATIGGGAINYAGAVDATVSGGEQNFSYGFGATVAGGLGNLAGGGGSFIGGGGYDGTNFLGNYAPAALGSIIGGLGNEAAGYASTVAGGISNSAAGATSFAAGQRARASHDGAFVWADSTPGDFASTGPNQFLVRASGGVGLGTTNPAAKLHLYSAENPTTFRIQSAGTPGFGRLEFVSDPQGSANEWRPGYIQALDAGGFTGGLGFFVNGTGVGNKFGNVEVMRVLNGNVAISAPATVSFGSSTRQMLNLWGTQYGIGVQSSTVYFRTDNASGSANGFAWYSGGVHDNTAQNPGGGATLMKVDGTGLTVNGVLVSASDRNIKAGFVPVDSKAVLEKVATLPITRWHFTNDSTISHVGPMAQDFHAIFGVGTDDKHIATVDADGVALAAIQGLNQKLEEHTKVLEGELKRRDAENAELKQRLAALEKIIFKQKSN